MSLSPVPAGFHTLTPYIPVKGAGAFITYLQQVFDADELSRSAGNDGTVHNAELRIGNSMLMVAEANPGYPPRPGTLYMYVEDPDSFYHRATAAGAKSLREPTDEFYGDRCAGVEDAFGNHWWIAKRIGEVPAEDVAQGKSARS